jgi:HD-like signal output (HDOD) protein
MPDSLVLPASVHEPLSRFLADHVELPVLPEAAVRILALCQDQDADPADIERALERDPSLASHVLRIANSAMFAPVEPIVELRQAIGRLGMTTIRNLSLAASLHGRLFSGRQHEDLTRSMWAHSALAAVFAREVARRLHCSGEIAFLWGLMHDVGRPLVLQAALERPELLSAGADGTPLLDAAIDAFHPVVGAKLVEAWGLPRPTAIVIACHHDPAAAGKHAREARITRLADLLAHWAIEEALDEEDFPIDDPVIEALGMSAEDVQGLLAGRQRALASALALR